MTRVTCRPGRLLRGGLGLADGGLAGSEPRGLHPERGAAHVVQPDPVADTTDAGVAAVLAADAEVQRRVRRLAFLKSGGKRSTSIAGDCKRISMN